MESMMKWALEQTDVVWCEVKAINQYQADKKTYQLWVVNITRFIMGAPNNEKFQTIRGEGKNLEEAQQDIARKL
jgi:hypothetical protein